MNSHKLQQDHPCVIDMIRRFYLYHPPPANVPLRLDNSDGMDPSVGQVTAILKHLEHRQVILFFINTKYSTNNK